MVWPATGSWRIPPSRRSEHLKGKSVGSVRPGSGPDALLHRFLPKLGLVPGRDVTILPTGIAESNKRIIGMLQGNFDATLASWDNIAQLEIMGQKINVLADPNEFGVRTSVSDLTSTRQIVRERRAAMKAFFRAFCRSELAGQKRQRAGVSHFSQVSKSGGSTVAGIHA